MYCPECRVEYREGFAECSDCHVPLVATLPPEDGPKPEPDLDLVAVLEANNPVALAVAQSTLDEAGIPYYVLGSELSIVINAVDPHIHHWCTIQVARDREAEARTALAAIAEEDLVLNVDTETPEAEVQEISEES